MFSEPVIFIAVIAGLFLLLGLYIFWVRRLPDMDEPSSQPDSETLSVERFREAKALSRLRYDVNDFKNWVRSDIRRLYDECKACPELSEPNSFAIERLEEILGMDIKTESQLEYAEWLYNCGDLRTDTEIFLRQVDEENQEYLRSGRYSAECSMYKWVFGLGGFALGFFLPYSLCASQFGGYGSGLTMLAGGFLGVMGGCFGAWLGLLIASSVNVENGHSHNIPEDNPQLRKEKAERTAAIVSGAVAAVGIGRSIRKNTREFMNVDGWKQMK